MAWLKGWLNLTCIIIQWTSLFLYLRIWLNKLCSLTFLELCGSVWSSFLSISISINFHFHLFFMFFRFRFLFSFLSIFIADAAFLYLWAKLADWRDHPDDIYTLKLKIKIHLNHIYQNIYIPSGWYIHIHSNGNIRSLNQTNSNLFWRMNIKVI